MKLPAIFTTLLLSAFCVLSADKNELKVKVNHVYKIGSEEDDNRFSRRSKPTIQFNYDTKEVLQVTNVPEQFGRGIFLKRNEVDKFKKLMEKMLKFADAVYGNKITGVKKKFENRSIWTSGMDEAPYVNISETGDPTYKTDIICSLSYSRATSYFKFNYGELQELAKIFDGRLLGLQEVRLTQGSERLGSPISRPTNR